MKEFAASNPDETLLDVLENVNDVITVRDAETGETLAVGGGVEEMYGYTPEEFKSRRIEEYSADSDTYGRDEVERRFDEARREGEATFEWKAKARDGTEFWTEVNLSRTEIGDRDCLLSVIRDIDDRKEKENELERYKRLVSLVSDPVFTIDADDRIDFVNDAAVSFSGYSREELQGADPSRLVESEDEDGFEKIHRLVDGPEDSVRLEGTVERPDGSTRIIESNIAPLPSDDGEYSGAVGVARDITARKEREEHLERFASVLSHDLRNPLNAAQAQATLLREAEGVESDYLDTLDRLHDRMADIVDDVLTLAREGTTVDDPEPVELRRAVEKAWESTPSDEGTVLVDDDLGTVRGDPRRVRRLFENLLDNAVTHAGPDVTVRVEPLPDGFAVADDGPGIPPEERDNVFEYGYSTAERGTGFGLNIVAEIAKAHGWTVSLGDGDAEGARFEVTGVSG
ncbi:sensor histidine kinase [Halopelagius longus]|uniref:histidine kinase n=1 Tax=Halopelagius longus TaxID=1236180 RepID=A0A1H1DG23_9EURY|nr:PAS domain-containing sensor histidine kinase [Halopelagius longus]RDI71309.1 PAS domain-containing sensor histidine kinase [Halopelagius longus]SDQ75169.1 PAS domain S-box-containing protein [Halopelagius longus]